MLREKFLGFTGAVMIAFGIILAIQGTTTAAFIHAAAGVPLWSGLLFVMTGCANLTQAFEKRRKQRDDMPFSFTIIICNFIALLVASICIGFITWGSWSYINENATYQQLPIELYSAVIVASVIIFFLSLIAMFVDCCCSLNIFGPRSPSDRPMYYADYPPRQVPAIYKA